MRILVIKLGALGDFVQAMGPAAAIRAHHRDAEITLLTTAPYAELAGAAPYFDAVWIDTRPSLLDPVGLWRLRRKLRQGRFDLVYDLKVRWIGYCNGLSLVSAHERDELIADQEVYGQTLD